MDKDIIWMPKTRKTLKEFPDDVRINFGHGLRLAQQGEHPDIAKPFKHLGTGASLLELVDDCEGDTFRAVYTVEYQDAIVVLHVFKKKSKKGSATPKPDIELIRERLKASETYYQQWKKEKQVKK